MPKSKKSCRIFTGDVSCRQGKACLCRGQSLVLTLTAFLLMLNLLCLNPLRTLLDVVANPVAEISEESATEAKELITEIAGEGVVMVKNDGLSDGGFELNQTLSDLYVSYADTRPEAGMSNVDWTLPEPGYGLQDGTVAEASDRFDVLCALILIFVEFLLVRRFKRQENNG